MSKLTQAFEGLLGTKQDILASFPALLGNGQGIVDVPGEVNKVFVRVADQVQEVRCTRLTVRIDWLPIIVGTTAEEPNVTQVLSANLGVLNAMGYALGTVTSHALTHQLWATDGGTDPIYLQGYQILPGRLGPVATSVSVTVYPFILYVNDQWQEIGNVTLSLSAQVPATAGKCRMVLISVDTSGDLVQTAGSEVDLASLAPLTDTPQPPAGTKIVLGAVRCYQGQTKTQMGRQNKDILDLRWFVAYHTHDAVEVGIANVKLDDLAVPDDNTDLNATTGHHGLLAKLGGGTTNFLRADGTWAAPPAGGAADPNFYIDGRLVAIANTGGAYVSPKAQTIDAIYIYCKDPGSAGSTIVDINKNGTTIFTTQGNRPTLAYNDADGVAKGTPDVAALAENDVLTLDIDQVATGVESLSVVITFTGGSGGESGSVASTGPLSGLATYGTKMERIEAELFNAGTTRTLIDYSGSGMVLSFWAALSGNYVSKDAVYKIYVDGEENPSVEFDIGSLGLHFMDTGVFSTNNVSIENYSTSRWSSFTFKFAIPFASHIRIDAINPTGTNGSIYSQVFYTTDITDTKRLKSAGNTWVNKVTVNSNSSFDFLDLAAGSGVVVWHSMVFQGVSNNTAIESDVNVYVNGEGSPSISSTGTEDWFMSAWDWLAGARSTPWELSTYNASNIHVAGLDLMELLGGIKFDNGITVTWDTAEATTNAYLSYLILYYED